MKLGGSALIGAGIVGAIGRASQRVAYKLPVPLRWAEAGIAVASTFAVAWAAKKFAPKQVDSTVLVAIPASVAILKIAAAVSPSFGARLGARLGALVSPGAPAPAIAPAPAAMSGMGGMGTFMTPEQMLAAEATGGSLGQTVDWQSIAGMNEYLKLQGTGVGEYLKLQGLGTAIPGFVPGPETF